MPHEQHRLNSLDIFRGFAILSMLLANNPGSWVHILPFLKHAEWDGFKFADWIFPSFLFITGFSTFISINNKKLKHSSAIKHIFIRAGLLFLAGLFLNGFPDYLGPIRVMGVLQRIAIVYLIVSIIYFYFPKSINIIALGILILYWLILKYYYAPDGSIGWVSNKNLNGYIDVKILGDHIWKHSPGLDPEGILSTLPSIASGLSGVIAAKLYYKYDKNLIKTVTVFIITAFILSITAFLWNLDFPFNKTLWSSSYVLLTSGISFFILGILIYPFDIKKYNFLYLKIFGVNPLAIYFFSGIFARSLQIIKINSIPIKEIIFLYLTQLTKNSEMASILYTFFYIQIFYFIFLYFYNKKIIIKI